MSSSLILNESRVTVSKTEATRPMPSTSSFDRTSPSILARIRQRDPAAWSQFVELYAPLVAAWCRQRGLSLEDTADVVQEVFWAVSRGVASFVPHGTQSGQFRSWLWVITRNKIRDWARAKKIDRAEGGSSAVRRLHTVAGEQDSDDEPTAAGELNALTRRALSQVESQFERSTWQAFWRTAVDGVPTQVVADELGLSPAAIRQARSRVLRRLRAQLGDGI